MQQNTFWFEGRKASEPGLTASFLQAIRSDSAWLRWVILRLDHILTQRISLRLLFARHCFAEPRPFHHTIGCLASCLEACGIF